MTDLPMLIRDGSLAGLFFRVAPARAASLLPEGLEPLPVLGRAMALLCVFEYRDTTLGSYNEIGLGVFSRRRGTRPSLLGVARDARRQDDQAIWVSSLPVTTQAAFTAGRDVWGYPKYVTGIETDFRGERAHVRLEDEMELSITRGRSPELAGLPFVTFSLLGGHLVRTIIDVEHRVRWGGMRSTELRVLGDGPTARDLRTLDLDGARPLAAFRTDELRAVLPAGRDLGALDPRAARPRAPGRDATLSV